MRGADALLDARLKTPFTADANDTLYQWASSGDYNPAPNLDKSSRRAGDHSADDERNPPETGIVDRENRRLKNGSYYLIPASPETVGHGTTEARSGTRSGWGRSCSRRRGIDDALWASM